MSTRRKEKLARRERRQEKKRKARAPYQPLVTPEALAAARVTRERTYQPVGVFFDPKDGMIKVIEVLK